MQLITVDEFESLGNVSVGTETVKALTLIEAASAQVDTWCNRFTFQRIVNDTVRLHGIHGDRLELPGRPIETVTSVTVDGDAVTDWMLVGDVLWRAGWSGTSVPVEVVYTHGYDGAPADVKAVVAQAAARAWQSGPGIAQESVGSYSVTYARESAGVSLLASEREQLSRYRRTTASVPL